MPLQLLDLSEELILIILEYVHNSSPHTSRSLRLVNKYLYVVVKAIHNRQKTLNIQYLDRLTKSKHDKENWTQKAAILDSIRHLTLTDNPGNQQTSDVNVDQISSLIEKLGNLKILIWNIGPVPTTILELLERKNVELRIFSYWRRNPGLHDLTEEELALSSFKKLTNFRAAVMLSNSDHPESCTNAYLRMIANSDSLRYVGICDALRQAYTTRPLTGGTDEDEPGAIANRCSSIKNLTLDSRWLTLSKSLLETLNTHIDISRLETLKFVRGQQQETDYFQCAASMLPSIKHVSLNFAAIGNRTSAEIMRDVNDYLLECPPLTSLSLWDGMKFVDMEKLIMHHSSTIEILQIHEKCLSQGYQLPSRESLSVSTIALMRNKCLRLQELTLDLRRTDGSRHQQRFSLFLANCSDATLAILDEVKLFGSRLAKLQVYVEGVAENFTYPLPSYVDSARELDQSDACYGVPDDASDSGIYGMFYNRANDRADVDSGAADTDEVEGEDESEDETEDAIGGSSDDDDSSDSDIRTPPLDAQTIAERKTGWEALMQNFAEEIWRRVYGKQDFGERCVDVKFGEWEAKENSYYHGNRRWFEVRPHERDDRLGDCFTKMTRPRA